MKRTLSILLNVLIAVMAPWAWLRMALRASGGLLSSGGLGSLKYFTVLSNLLAGLASQVFLVALALGKRAPWISRLKYIAAVSVGLTFVTVMVFLGPLFGYRAMFTGSTFWMHLVLPLAAAADFVFFNETPMARRDNLLATVPMLLYGAAYVGNNLINGTGQQPHANDWYAFLTWGYPVGVLIFFAVLLATFLIGLAFRKANQKLAGGAYRSTRHTAAS